MERVFGCLLMCLVICQPLVDADGHMRTLKAQCVVLETSGDPAHRIWGTLTLTQDVENHDGMDHHHHVTITGILKGFDTTDEYSTHGFHIHEKGELSNQCKDAGGHYNPHGTDHGAPTSAETERHVGDLGNIYEAADGTSQIDITDHMVHLSGEFSVVGRSIVIHEKEDDLGANKDTDEGSRKTGNAGGRLACCQIIGVAETHVSSAVTFYSPIIATLLMLAAVVAVLA